MRERTLKELFQVLSGVEKGECEFYPCHFEGQNCDFCYCPFYPCLIRETGGYLKGKVWSCKNCDFIHKKDVAEKVKFVLGSYPRQVLIEEDWVFFNEILQDIFFGEIRGRRVGKAYTIYDFGEEEECYLVILENFEIKDVKRGVFRELTKEEGVIIPI